MELLCIKTHSRKAVMAGNTYVLMSDKSPCKCELVNVGVKSTTYMNGVPAIVGCRYKCVHCGQSCIEDGIWWINRSLFAQIATEDEVKETEQIKELIEQ